MKKTSCGKSSTERQKLYRIYVGSIAGHIKQEQILEYFSRMGKIGRIRMFYKDYACRVNKGYCHLILDDKRTYERILHTCPHFLAKRRLYCTPLMSGRRLEKLNSQNNHKRVILRNLPADLTEEGLYEIVSRYGKVDVAYIFKAHGLMRQNFSFSPTASVQFNDGNVATSLVSQHILEVTYNGRCLTLVAYPYIHNYNELKSQFNSNKETLLNGIQKKDLLNRIPNSSPELPEYILKEELVLQLNLIQDKVKNEKSIRNIGISEEDMMQHSVKPTSKEYHIEKQRICFGTGCSNYILNRSEKPKQYSSNPPLENPVRTERTPLESPNTITPKKDDDCSRKGLFDPCNCDSWYMEASRVLLFDNSDEGEPSLFKTKNKTPVSYCNYGRLFGHHTSFEGIDNWSDPLERLAEAEPLESTDKDLEVFLRESVLIDTSFYGNP